MVKPKKSEVVKLMADLKAKGFSNEKLGDILGRSSQTIYSWGQAKNTRTPCKSDWEILQKLAK